MAYSFSERNILFFFHYLTWDQVINQQKRKSYKLLIACKRILNYHNNLDFFHNIYNLTFCVQMGRESSWNVQLIMDNIKFI